MASPLTSAEARAMALRVAREMEEAMMRDRQQEAAVTACPQCAELRARITELEVALAAAREDTARLDAHENLGPWAPMFDDAAGCQEKWLWYDKAGYPRRSATFRDAIDAARKEQG